ncbi:MAG: CoA synthetase [Rhodospirillaceae bacterium]|jgi:glutaconate CoA-transferase subunit A|nr:CoA synthetase [Rhodospirillales bacterium]MBT3906541.1 CoA synthetase [Rhodospirillaceae bacterium]MBT4699445.1 CoA synthetase [Rhodospirillaceae bacterium]MBT5035887.1 CoA synthetase [Rhodospirillaceae bacterium]MBT6222172.1 CoA synthetase [Rhodospirillaceae bacterium]
MSERVYSTVDDLVAGVPDGAKIAVVKDECGVAMEATRALIRKGIRRLHIVTVPTSGLQTDLFVGAGSVATVETSAITLGEFGAPPNFVRAVKAGSITLKDATCPAVYAGLQAAEKGIPFMPMRGLIGSDIEGHRDEFKIIENPFADDDPVIALPAIQPDIALVHAPLADRHGNVWIGRERALLTMAHAAKETLATVEEIIDGSLLEDEKLAPGCIPSLYVSGIAEAKNGSWPMGLPGRYAVDAEHMALYCDMAKTKEGFRDYLDRFVMNSRQAAE